MKELLTIILWMLAAAMLALMIGGLVNPKLATNKKTGQVPSRMSLFATFSIFAAIFAVLAGATTPNDKPTPATAQRAGMRHIGPPAPQPAKEANEQFKAEQIVEFPKGAPVCLTKDTLQRYLKYSSTGEATKAKALFVGDDGGPSECLMLKPHTQAKIISATYDPSVPGVGIIEVVGKDVGASEQGAFGFAIGDLVKLVH